MAIPEKIYETNGAEETFEVGMRLAKEAKAGDIYCCLLYTSPSPRD